MRNYYREQKFYCGDFLDVQIYPVYKKAISRSKKKKPSSEIQQKLNHDNAAKKLTRLMHTNFTRDDYEIHLTYMDENIPTDELTAKKDVQNFIRRAKRLYSKAGNEDVKYIWVTEKGKRTGRVHHHITISGGVDRTELERLWGKGYANTKALQFTKNGIAGLAHYIVKDPLFFKRWNASRNLKKPIESCNDYKITKKKAIELSKEKENRELFEALYPGYLFSECVPFENEVNGGRYLSIRMYRKEARLL